MARRGVNLGISILVALVLLLAVTSSPLRQALGHSGIFRVKPPRRGIASATICCGLEARTAHSLRVARPATDVFNDEMEADVEAKPTAASPPASELFEVFAPLPLRVARGAGCFAVAGAPPPLRC
jgi:hypothetical protein